MSGDDRLRMQGLLAEKEQEARRLSILLAGHRDRVRRLTDKHAPVAQMNMTELRIEVDAMTDCDMRLQALLREVAALREDLGLPRYEAR